MHGTKTEDANAQAWFKVKAPHTVEQERKEMLGTVQSLSRSSYRIPCRQVFVESPRQLSSGPVRLFHDVLENEDSISPFW